MNECGEQRIQHAERSQCDADGINRDRACEIEADDTARSSGNLHCFSEFREIVPEQHDVGAPALAATFDSNKPVTVKGIITYVVWTNPHVWLYMDVTDANGKVTTWGINGGAPASLKNHGWNRDSLRPGDQIVVEGLAAKSGQNLAAAKTITMTNGTKIVIVAK